MAKHFRDHCTVERSYGYITGDLSALAKETRLLYGGSLIYLSGLKSGGGTGGDPQLSFTSLVGIVRLGEGVHKPGACPPPATTAVEPIA